MLNRLDDLQQVEAKYPALLFKQQITAFLEKIYGLIQDNLKKEISPLLGLCIQVPLVVLLIHVTGAIMACSASDINSSPSCNNLTVKCLTKVICFTCSH